MYTGCDKKSMIYEDGAAFVNELAGEVSLLTPEETRQVMDTASAYFLIDVREAGEYAYGFIPEAVNMPRGVMEFNINREAFWDSRDLYPPEKDELIIIYCKKGMRSVLCASTLQKMGYTNVFYIEGGFKAWEKVFPNDFERLENAEDESGGPADFGDC